MIGKTFARVIDIWKGSTSKTYVLAVVEAMRWKAVLTLALMLCMSVAQGAQLLLIIPLMQLVGLNAQRGSVGWLFELVSSAFAAFNIRPTLITVLGALIFFTTLVAVVSRWQATLRVKLVLDFMALLRRRLYWAITQADWLTFSRSRASDFTHALTTELDRTGSGAHALFQALTSILLLLVYALFALRLSPVMTALALIAGGGLVLLLKRKRQAARSIGEDMSRAGANMYSAVTEHLSGMKTAKSYGMEKRSADIFSMTVDEINQKFISATRVFAGSAFLFSVGSVLILSAILYVSMKVLNISAAGLIMLLLIYNRMIPLFNSVQQSYQNYLNALPAFARVTEMVARCEAAAEPKAARSEEVELQDSIRFERVSFAYGEGERGAICDLDMIIGAGKTTAIVGPSGAGKSTIADLVMGLILPSEGRVLVDGRPLGPELMRFWRARIGYVAQETFLFNDTVRANLLWVCPDANEEQVWQALKLASAAGFVSELPEGLETVMGDWGVRLSGGERQRLALARALLREPSLLILDEATSALDSENERRIQKSIEDLHGRTTILVITHRLSTIRRADVIHVLEGGRLVESGSWEALVSRESARFAALARAQRIGEEE